jgi:hypothetical protein
MENRKIMTTGIFKAKPMPTTLAPTTTNVTTLLPLPELALTALTLVPAR